MKKYKINNRVITADSPTKALKIHKLVDSVKDSKAAIIREEIKKAYPEAQISISTEKHPAGYILGSVEIIFIILLLICFHIFSLLRVQRSQKHHHLTSFRQTTLTIPSKAHIRLLLYIGFRKQQFCLS